MGIRKKLVAIALVLAAMACAGNTFADTMWVEQKLRGDGAQAGDLFGLRVLVAGDTAFVSAPAPGVRPGSVYVYALIDGTWQQQQVLVAEPQEWHPEGWSDFFGWSLSLSSSGDTLVVGATNLFRLPFGPVGGAYVFTLTEQGWEQQAELTAGDIQPSGWAGVAVAIHDDTIVVGAQSHDGQAGAAYVFTDTGGDWLQTQKLEPSVGLHSSRNFGGALAFDGETLLIGAPGPDWGNQPPLPPGAVYVFGHDGGGWLETQILRGDEDDLGPQSDKFGHTIALAGTRALIGAPQANRDDIPQPGAAYVFESNGGTWARAHKLVIAEGDEYDKFGLAVAWMGDQAIIGEWNRNSAQDGSPQPPPQVGRSHLFAYDGAAWERVEIFFAGDAKLQDSFGWHVGMDSATVMIGATDGVAANPFEGAAYAYSPVPDGYGVVGGVVTGLGYCSGEPELLVGATIAVDGSGIAVASMDNGFYQFAVPAGTVTLSVTAPGYVPLTVEGVETSAGGTVAQDFEMILDAPCSEHAPDPLAAVAEIGGSTTRTLTITNQGAAQLTWEIAAAAPLAAPVQGDTTGHRSEADGNHASDFAWQDEAAITDFPRPARGLALSSALDDFPGTAKTVHSPVIAGMQVDCDSEPGLIVHDDGTVDDGYSVNAPLVAFVDKFTPAAYPAPFRTVCAAFLTLESTSLDFEIVIFADDGPGGAPGTELGALSVSGEGLPVAPPIPPEPIWFGFDIASLDITVDSGSIYIGVRWAPNGQFIAADHAGDRPQGLAGGYRWSDVDNVWLPLAEGFSQYRSLFVRASANPAGCVEPDQVSWLSVEPAAGATAGGESSAISITFDASALALGDYEANLCLASNDPRRSLVVVPVHLTVVPVMTDPVFSDRFEQEM